MSWSIGFDEKWNRDVGYGVPSVCDHPSCSAEIDRGLGYICGGDIGGGENGCGLFFCGKHLYPVLCNRCHQHKPPYKPSPDKEEWLTHKLTCPSWAAWRYENKEEVERLKRCKLSTCETDK